MYIAQVYHFYLNDGRRNGGTVLTDISNLLSIWVLGNTNPSKKKHFSLLRKLSTYSGEKEPSKASEVVRARCSDSNRQLISSPPSPIRTFMLANTTNISISNRGQLQELFHNRCRSGTSHHLYQEPRYQDILLIELKPKYSKNNILPIFRRRQIHSCLDSVRLSISGHLRLISLKTAVATVSKGVPW